MPQPQGVPDSIGRRTDAVVAVLRDAGAVGALDARSATATRLQRPRRVATLTGANNGFKINEAQAPAGASASTGT